MEKAKAVASKIKAMEAAEKTKQNRTRKKVTIQPIRKEFEFPGNVTVVGFAIRAGKGKDTKKKFDQKLIEGVKFLQQDTDKMICIAPLNKTKLEEMGIIKELVEIPKL